MALSFAKKNRKREADNLCEDQIEKHAALSIPVESPSEEENDVIALSRKSS
jgi:hypothetical protein